MAADLLDALSLFAIVGLGALTLGTATWLGADHLAKRRALDSSRKGLEDLVAVHGAIARLMKDGARSDMTVEAVVLGRLIVRQRVDSEIGEAVGSAIGLRDPAAFQELASWTADWIRDHPKDAEEKLLAPLARARLVVGQTPVSAVEFALREEPQDKSEEAPQEKPERQPDFARELGSPTYVFGFLQRCDRVELAVAGLASSPRRSIEEDESGGGR